MATVLHLGTDDGVTTLRDEGGSWSVREAKMPTWAVEEVVVVPSSPNIVLAGTRGDGVWRSEDGGATFSKPSRGKRGPGKVRCLTLDPVDDHRVYAGCEPIDLYVSDDLGENWTLVESVRAHPWVSHVTYPVPTVEPHLRDIAIDPSDRNVIYLALQVGFILKSVDGGATWQLLDQGFDADVHTFAIDPTDPSHIAIATGGENSRRGTTGGKALFQSHDGGSSWEPLALNFDLDYSIPYVMKPGQPEVAFSALANSNPGQWRQRESGAEAVLVRTKDGGQSWEQIELVDMPGYERHMVVAITPDPDDPEHLFAAFSNGELITSTDGGDSWSRLAVAVKGTNDIKAVSV